MKMRAKLTLDDVTKHGDSESLTFRAKYSDKPEDNSFAKATPSAELTMTVDNPDLSGKFKAGQEFYVDFTPIK